jgi:dTDP-4-amino-4,6-dideoxygalactose transaminase
MSVPFLDVGAAYRELQAEIDQALLQTADKGSFILGAQLEQFEAEFAGYIDTTHCVGVASGTDALVLALLAAGIGPGDEVIVPANTFIATWIAVSRTGATPVPVEPLETTYTLDPAAFEAALTASTRAVIPVHLYGQPADMAPVMEVANRHGLFVLEDAAQAHGASYMGRPAGALGHAAAWSFYPSKNLGAFGDGGAVTTRDADIAKRVRLLRNYGSEVKNVHGIEGFNSRLDEIQAAVLRVKLRHLDSWNARRAGLALSYKEELQGCELILPAVSTSANPVWHLFVVRSGRREPFRSHLERLGVHTQIHYPTPPHLQPAFARLGLRRGALPVSEQLHEEVVSLPIGPHLSFAQLAEVVDAVHDFQLRAKQS